MMQRKLQWDFDAWEDYLYWQAKDKKILQRINQLINDILRDPFREIGKPEPLKGRLAGFWSRRIDEGHRLVYLVEGDKVFIFSCRGHYND